MKKMENPLLFFVENVKALKECDAIVLLDRKGLASRGMDVEIKIAVRFDIRIFTLDNFIRNPL